MQRILRPCAVLGLLTLSYVSTAQATTYTSSRVDVALQATVVNAVGAVITVPAVAFGVVTPGTINAALPAQAVLIATTWSLSVGQTCKMYAYFDSASTALAGTASGTLIPTSAVTAAVNGGSALSFTGTNPFNASSTSATIFSVPITTGNAVTTRTDSVALSLNLTGMALVADSYVGTLHFQAQAQ